jgi:hypothetical protein
MSDFEQRGSFYMGREYDLQAVAVVGEKVLYDANDLTTHAVCVGMTGSGKTGLCLSLIEEAALDGIPVIAIDPKGDLGNLLLAFPELRPSDFQPWIDPAVAVQKGVSIEQLAEQTAATWRDGLGEWGIAPDRIARFNAAVDKVIYTPGSSAGVPLTVLKSFRAPPAVVVDDTDTYNDLLQSTTQSILALVGIDADPVQSREAILVSNILNHAWHAGRDLGLSELIHDIQKPPFAKVGIVDLENFLPAKERLQLGMKINNLLASPSFASWLEGEALDVQSLLYTADNKPRLSILSISHLNDAERMFFVTILLNEVLGWMRSQPGTGSLRAILYMDEVFGYFPPSANPPSKRPMLTLLKQARAFGLGVVLATQNPVDLDYKGLSNAGTWFLGRLQTERDKMRVIEGLESLDNQSGTTFDRATTDKMLSSLRGRVFLVKNVHQGAPTVMHTRWAMSYLRGPLTRDQIRTLMLDRKAVTAEANPTIAASRRPASSNQARPMLSGTIVERFWPMRRMPTETSTVEYQPALFCEVTLPAGTQQNLLVRRELSPQLPSMLWEGAALLEAPSTWDTEPYSGSQFQTLAAQLTNDKSYKIWRNELEDWIKKQHRTLRDMGATLNKLQDSVRKVQAEVDESKWWWFGSLWRFIEVISIRLLGGSTRKQIVTQTSTKQMSRGRRRHSEAKAELAELTQELGKLQQDQQQFRETLVIRLSSDITLQEQLLIAIENDQLNVGTIGLAWLPRESSDGKNEPLF